MVAGRRLAQTIANMSTHEIQLFQLRGKRSNMSAKGLSGKTNFISEYITIHRFSTKLKIRSCFLMNINRDYVSLETKFCSVCVFLIVTPSKLFALVFDFFALLGAQGDNLAVYFLLYAKTACCKTRKLEYQPAVFGFFQNSLPHFLIIIYLFVFLLTQCLTF